MLRRNLTFIPEGLFVLILFLVFAFTSVNSDYSQATPPEDYLCGDADANGLVNLSDVLYIANYFLKGGAEPVPMEAADVNCDQQINIGDVIFLANSILKGGYPPCWAEHSVDFDSCKTFQRMGATDTIPPDQDCIEYEYDGENVLCIKHINAGFNCCPAELKAFVDIKGDTITIEEKEYFDDTGPCFCLCLFDLDFNITGLNPGVYTVKVIEMYVPAGDEPLEFTVDLTTSTSGIFCVKRSGYPWIP